MPENPVTEVELKNRETNELFTDKFRMIFIDLFAFKKKDEKDLENDLERWIYNIRYMGQ